MKKASVKIPPKTLGYLLIGVGLIVVVVLAGILPLHRYNSKQHLQIKKIQNQIEEQKGLGPLNLALTQAKDQRSTTALPNPRLEALPSDRTDEFQDAFRTLAGRLGLMTVSLAPDLGSLAGTDKKLLYQATVKGEFSNFRKMLIGLEALPYLSDMDNIEIRQFADAMEMRLSMTIALSE